MIPAAELRREPAPDWIPLYCLSGHQHGNDRARRGCNAFGRAYARFERIDGRYRGRALHEQQGAFDLWRCAGNLVNRLFTIAMSDLREGDRR